MNKIKFKIIGIHEYITLPKAGIQRLESKTDTGAYNSAIDCCFVEEIQGKDGTLLLRYILLNEKHPLYTGTVHSTKHFKIKKVRSSNGIETPRYQIKLKVVLKNQVIITTFNLSNRSAMRYSVLLGRKLLASRFLVDVSLNRKIKKGVTPR